MAYAYLLDPTNQFQNRAGVNNVHGFFKVYLANTDDLAVTYKDFNGTLNPERIDIDNNGRAVIIADSSRPYRVEMYEPNGDLVFTQQPVWTVASGGGMTMVDIESTDGSVSVQKTSSGGMTTYDLSVDSEDDSRYLDWIKCSWYDLVDGAYVPRYESGTMSVGAKGLNLTATMLYHITATVRANKTGERSPFYDNIGVHFSLFDGENTVEVQNFTRIVDHSLGLSQDFTVDADIKVGSLDSQLVVTIDGAESGVTFNLMSVEAHRIYSGVPKIPEGIASESWVDDNYQKKLVAGEGITIDPTTNEISADAQPQVQADWSQTNPESAAFIKNKPNLATVATTGSYNDLNGKPNLASVATSGSYDDLSNKPTIPAAQVQSDWGQRNTQAVDYIKNKPVLATVATSGSYNDLSDKPDIPSQQEQANWTEQDSSKPSYIKNKPNLASVATSGDYNDLSNKPSIPAAQVQSDWGQSNSSAVDYIKNKPQLASVATSGSYNDLSDKPSIPAAQVQSDWNQSDNTAVDYIKNKPTIPQGVPTYSATEEGKVLGVVDNSGTPALDWVEQSGGTQVQADWTEQDSSDPSYIQNKPNLASVATSGSYNDLSDKPTIPAAQVQSDWSQSDNTQVDYIKNKPNLASVATSGDYEDLSNKPTIPAAPVQSNWNESDNTSLAYIQNKPNLASVATSGSYDDLSNKPTIPAAQVQSDWSQSDNTQVDYIKNKPNLATVATTGDYDDLSNKPSIPVVPAMKSLVAGQNVTITEDANGVTISASGATQQQADWNQTNSQAVDYIKNKPNLASVATSGSYNDLSNKPSIPGVEVGSNSVTLQDNGGDSIEMTYTPQTVVQSDFHGSNANASTIDGSFVYTIITLGEAVDIPQGTTVRVVLKKDIFTAMGYARIMVDNSASSTSGTTLIDLPQSNSIVAAGTYNIQTSAAISGTFAYIKMFAAGPTASLVTLDAGDFEIYIDPVEHQSVAIPTVDQTYDGTSSNAQSGVAVASALSGKEDDFDAGEGLEFTTDGQGNRVLQVEGPVDIVAGPGIVIDNPDGNTLRVSQATPCDETVLWDGNGTGSASVTLSESMEHFKIIRILVGNSTGADGLEYKFFKASPTHIKHIGYHAGGGGNEYWVGNYVECTATTIAITKNANVYKGYTDNNINASNSNSGYSACIHEVVGIHRIANN